MEEYHCDAEHVYAVTLSAELSGSYNSAVLGKNMYEEEYGEKDIYVFNSRSASVGETLIGLKIAECEEKGMSFQEVIETVESYIEEQHTYFVLETLDILKKNGRLKGLKRRKEIDNDEPSENRKVEYQIYEYGYKNRGNVHKYPRSCRFYVVRHCFAITRGKFFITIFHRFTPAVFLTLTHLAF